MSTYFFHITYDTFSALDEKGYTSSTPYKAITEAELNLLTYALEAKVRGTTVPQHVAVVEEGKPRKLVSIKSTDA